MNQHQPQGQPWITLQKVLIILTVVTFIIGDNIYEQMRGESIFDTIYSYLTRSSEPAPEPAPSEPAPSKPAPPEPAPPTPAPSAPARIGGAPHRWLPSSAIPPEMKRSDSKSNPNPDQELQQLGWISNQLDTYTNPEICQTPRGLNKLAMQGVLFKDADGAKEAFDGWYYQKITPHAPIASNNQVGESAYTYWANFVNDDCSPHHDLRVFSILFKRYNAIGVVQLDGIIGTISEGELEALAIKLAQEMDSKMVDEVE